MKLDDFHRRILVHVPGASDPSIDTALRDAACRFFEDSACWIGTLDPIRTRAGRAEYDLFPDRDVQLVRVLSARTAHHALALGRPHEGYEQESGAVEWMSVPDRRTAIFWPTPAGEEVVTVTAVLTPSPDFNTLPDAVAVPHAQAIADGAVARLLMHPGAYRDPARAGAFMSMFDDAVGRAKVRAFYGNAASAPRVRATFF